MTCSFKKINVNFIVNLVEIVLYEIRIIQACVIQV
jgi:hypothetical protein